MPFLEDLLAEMSGNEIKKLLIKVIPETYYEELEGPPSGFDDEDYRHVLPTLKFLFRIAYEHSDENTQREVSLNFVRILKEEDSNTVIVYSQIFWWTDQLKHLCDDHAQIIKKHFFSRIKEDDYNPDLINMLSGIGKYLSSSEVSALVDILIRIICRNRPARTAASRLLQDEYNEMDEDAGRQLLNRLEFWQTHFTRTGRDELADIAENERAMILLNDEPPF